MHIVAKQCRSLEGSEDEAGRCSKEAAAALRNTAGQMGPRR